MVTNVSTLMSNYQNSRFYRYLFGNDKKEVHVENPRSTMVLSNIGFLTGDIPHVLTPSMILISNSRHGIQAPFMLIVRKN